MRHTGRAMANSSIYVGVGGWTYAPWRGVFYPDGLTQKRELEYASGKLTSIEVNGTYYGSQKPDSFRKWFAETPEDFVFSLKGPRFATNRRVLAEAGDSIERFLKSGLTELKHKLGPINWQLAPTKTFDPADMEAFLKLLPKRAEGQALRHVVEARHESFRCRDFVALLRKHHVAAVVAGDSAFPCIADATADFVYARIMGTTETAKAGYPPKALDAWAKRAKAWARGDEPDDLATVAEAAESRPRTVFLYVISGFKQSNPAAAMALIERLE